MRKFLAIFIAIVLALTLSFAGCAQEAEPVEEEAPAEEEPVEAEPAEEPAEEVTEEPVEEEVPAEEEPAEEDGGKFGLEDIPEIENDAPLNLIVETGSVFDKIIPYIQEFTAQTGVNVNVERVASPVVYSKENVELVAGTGVYDLAYVETSWTTEWSPYLYDLRELAEQYDPGGVEAFNKDIENHSPVILSCGQAYGNQMVLPFYTYHMGMFIRQDVYDDATEQEAFLDEYGYDLAAPTTYEELRDQAEFFTRDAGDTLKGEALDDDLYGVAMQAGAYQINDEFSCYLWGKDSDYVTVKRDGEGNIEEYVITEENKAAMEETMEQYTELTNYGSPGCLTANFDFVVAEQGEGRAIIQTTMFSNCFAWTAGLLDENVDDPEAKLGIYPTIGDKPYTGAWSFGVVKETDNPEAAYWLVRYLSSYECQEAVMKEGGQLTTRMDVLSDPEWKNEENMYPFGILVDYLLQNWQNEDFIDFIDDVWYFNSSAAGKVYEMQMNVLAKPVHGEMSVEEGIAELVKQTIELTSKFDDVPISEE